MEAEVDTLIIQLEAKAEAPIKIVWKQKWKRQQTLKSLWKWKPMDGPTDGPTDGQRQLMRCEDASKN